MGLKVAFVARDDLDGFHELGAAGAAVGGEEGVFAGFGFDGDEVVEVGELLEGGEGGDVVDEEEGVGSEVRGGPHSAVFFLPCCVGYGEVVVCAVDTAR